MNHVRQKTAKDFTRPKPFFNNPRMTGNTRIRTFNAIVRSQRIQQIFSRTIRSAIKILLYISSRQIRNKIGLNSMAETASTLGRYFENSVHLHTNASISSLVRFKHKPSDRNLRLCSLVR